MRHPEEYFIIWCFTKNLAVSKDNKGILKQTAAVFSLQALAVFDLLLYLGLLVCIL